MWGWLLALDRWLGSEPQLPPWEESTDLQACRGCLKPPDRQDPENGQYVSTASPCSEARRFLLMAL